MDSKTMHLAAVTEKVRAMW